MRCFFPADILLPDFEKINPASWPVIACDQFTSEMDYWKETEATVGGDPSTLRLILPEVYLGKDDEGRTAAIRAAMEDYTQNILRAHPASMILLRRTLGDGKVRQGLIGAIDLEAYDYLPTATSPIRATEETVLSRIPPRVKIRRGAPVELPHVMLLLDDPEGSVIEDAASRFDEYPVAYDIPLMQRGGRVEGRFLPEGEVARILALLDGMGKEEGSLVFTVGDGNHSLATAKACYEELKEKLGDAALSHPARYALVEAVNLHDASLEFHPIYRVVFGADTKDLLAFLAAGEGEGTHTFHYVTKEGEGEITMPATHALPVGTLQKRLDLYLAAHPEAEVDYIHGEDSLAALSKRDGAIGFLFRGMEKEDLFPAIQKSGVLPRKTFSMGEARDKRYYLEARSIR